MSSDCNSNTFRFQLHDMARQGSVRNFKAFLTEEFGFSSAFFVGKAGQCSTSCSRPLRGEKEGVLGGGGGGGGEAQSSPERLSMLLNLIDGNGKAPLHYAARNGHTEMINIFLALGDVVNLNIRDDEGRTALHYAARGGHTSAVEALIGFSTPLEEEGERGEVEEDGGGGALLDTAESEAKRCASSSTTTVFNKVDVNSVDRKQQRTALHAAAEEGCLGVVKALLRHPLIDFEAVDRVGSTPLSCASEYGHFDVVSAILDHCESIHNNDKKKTNPKEEKNAGDEEAAVYDVTARATTATSPLHHGKHSRTVALANKGDNNGITPLHCAARGGFDEVARILLAHGAAVDPRDVDGYTPLLNAVSPLRCSEEVSLLLINEYKADVNATIREGFFTPIHFVCCSPRPSLRILIALIEKGADVCSVGGIVSYGMRADTPLYLAASRGHSMVVAVLLSAGADLYPPSRRDIKEAEGLPLSASSATSLLSSSYSGVFAGYDAAAARLGLSREQVSDEATPIFCELPPSYDMTREGGGAGGENNDRSSAEDSSDDDGVDERRRGSDSHRHCSALYQILREEGWSPKA